MDKREGHEGCRGRCCGSSLRGFWSVFWKVRTKAGGRKGEGGLAFWLLGTGLGVLETRGRKRGREGGTAAAIVAAVAAVAIVAACAVAPGGGGGDGGKGRGGGGGGGGRHLRRRVGDDDMWGGGEEEEEEEGEEEEEAAEELGEVVIAVEEEIDESKVGWRRGCLWFMVTRGRERRRRSERKRVSESWSFVFECDRSKATDNHPPALPPSLLLSFTHLAAALTIPLPSASSFESMTCTTSTALLDWEFPGTINTPPSSSFPSCPPCPSTPGPSTNTPRRTGFVARREGSTVFNKNENGQE